jgi:hypothetical protein
MEDYALQICRYLPIKFVDKEADEFLEYLQEAYLINLEKTKYQFAFSALHMLYMVYIYKTKWFLKQRGNKKIELDLQNYTQTHKGTFFNSLFDLSLIPEKESLDYLLKTLSFHANDIGICKHHVDVRNNCLHSSGKVYYKNISNISLYIEEELNYIKQIHLKITPELNNLLEDFIQENWNKKVDIQDWLLINYLSEKDLETLTIIDLPIFKKKSDTYEIIFKKLLNILLISEIQKVTEVENKIIIKKLLSFMNELPQEIEITKEDGEKKKILTQEVIESYIIPIISNFNDKDRKEAEKILSL